jgi:hypothetical protein
MERKRNPGPLLQHWALRIARRSAALHTGYSITTALTYSTPSGRGVPSSSSSSRTGTA